MTDEEFIKTRRGTISVISPDLFNQALDRLAAANARLPRTADGVDIAIGMTVWWRYRDQEPFFTISEFKFSRRGWVLTDDFGFSMSLDACYSTREAAEKAGKP